MLRRAGAALLMSLCLTVAAPAGAAPMMLDRVVAVVNDEVILLSELEFGLRSSPGLQERLSQLGAGATPQQTEQIMREERSATLDDLIKNVLVKKEARRFQIEVNESDVERYLMSLAQAYGFSSNAELRKAVEESGEYGSWADYRQDIRDQLIVYKTTQSLANFAVTDAQVREQYRKMTRGETSTVDVERFVFTPDAAGAGAAPARDAAFAQAQATARRLRAGEDPAALATELSLTEPTRQQITRGEIEPAIEDAIFAAPQGGVVGPLETGQGYLVLKILEHSSSEVLSFEQAKGNIRNQLEAEAYEKAADDFRAGLVAKAHIDIRL